MWRRVAGATAARRATAELQHGLLYPRRNHVDVGAVAREPGKRIVDKTPILGVAGATGLTIGVG